MSSQSIAGAIATPLAADAGRRFDWLVIGGIRWLLGGLYADGWAHNNGLPDSFSRRTRASASRGAEPRSL